MSTSLEFILTLILAEVIPAAIFLFDSYWSFEIRKALASPIYRSHALWQGAVNIMVALAIFATYTSGLFVSTLLVVFYTAFFVVVFAFIDSTIKVARRSDPLLRPILRWDTIRMAGWCSIGALTIVNVVSYLVYPNLASSLIASILGNLFIAIPFVIGGPAILIGARRSADPILRSNLKWLGLAIVISIGLEVVSAIESSLGLSNFQIYYSYAALPTGLFYILMGYAFYKSARSLAPVSRLPLDETE
jgi:hypothetical protein